MEDRIDTSLKGVLAWGLKQLSQTPTDTPQLDVEILLLAAAESEHVLKIDFYQNPEIILSEVSLSSFKDSIKRRCRGEPVALIVGHQAFWSLDLKVSEDTLIPRPETELLIEIILEKCSSQSESILDLGTGSGAIALSLAKERPTWSITATDIYPQTLEIAQQNAILNHLNHVVFKLGSWFEMFKSNPTPLFSVIVSNPPYIAQNDPHLSHATLSFEPKRALVSGETGLKDIAHIIKQAPLFLKAGGLLVLEHGYDQKVAVQALFKQAGFAYIETRLDLAGLDRATFGFIAEHK